MSSPISTPKGGGAVSGLGEKFSPDLFTGTGNFSVPIALLPGRNGFQPELGLQYSTGSGNSPFGLGWNLSVPGVMRKTAKGVPRYDDEKDTFILSGAEDLVAVKRMNIRFIQGGNNSVTNNAAGIIPFQNEIGIITQYRPRTEGLFARIYHLKTNLRNCWKVMSKNGLTSWYGSKDLFEGDLSVVQNPDYVTSIFAWKLTRTEDTFGNHILYFYDKELVKENDYHKWDQNFLKEIKYADYKINTETNYMVSVLFNYENRTDAFSDFKAGFEIRTTKRCKNIQVFTNPVEGQIKTRTYHFQYSDEVLPVDELPYNGVSLLCKVEVEGHDGLVSEFLPPLEFRYTHFKPKQQKFKKLEGKEMPLASLANPGFELIDLFGNGLPDIVQINGVVRYWRNLGDGKFDIPCLMKDAPTGFNLGDPDVQLVDANGDGRTDLLVNGTNMAGYFSMKHDASWDVKAFKKYKQAPTFSFADPEVKMLDLTGDGITDALRNGSSFECFFHDKNDGWVETKRVPKKQIEDFPNVSFADPRIKLADMSGDGLQDIVQVYSGSVKYWPNLGYGNFGKPVVMKNAPRFPYPFDPSRLQIADVDGDGQADLIYVDAQKITFWINQSGNGWSEPFEITGTPFVTNINGIRIADIYGSGVSGVLYSFDAMADTQRNRWFFLDLTGGTKPYLLHEMDNNMGALTRVSYLPSTRYYLKDQFDLPLIPDPSYEPKFKNRKPWKTTLPFPVQVVSSVEVIDELSKGKLTTEYAYHHGYWDGGEREFRGFGRVDQRDTETFERYNTASLTPNPSPIGEGSNPSFNSSFVSNDARELEFNEVLLEHYSPPVETRNWFHLGPVGDEFGDWMEVDFSDEYFTDDPNVLKQDVATFQLLQSLPRRAKRDALRAWRGSSLRSELYAFDEKNPFTGEYIAGSNGRPYTVSESKYGLRLEAQPAGGSAVLSPSGGGVGGGLPAEVLFIPKETSGYVFFSFATSSRTTQWERGYDPMTQFSFTTGYNAYGQPCKQLSAALPRGIMPPYNTGVGTSPAEEGNKILSTASVTGYAQKDDEETYIVDRSCKTISYEVIQQNSEDVFSLKDRVFTAALPTEVGNIIFPIIGFSINYYDAPDEFGDGLSLGTIGKHGALARSETLALTDDSLINAYGSKPEFFKFLPEVQDFSAYPTAFVNALQNGDTNLGYKKYLHAGDANYATGYYTESGRTKYDWQNPLNTNAKGLVLATKDVFNSWAEIEYDDYSLLPKKAKQHLTPFGLTGDALETNAAYDYRVMQAKMITDPNGNRAVFDFSPLGLLKQSGGIGKPNANEGDIITEAPFAYKPSVLMEYDFFAFKNDGNPVWVKTIQREKHYQQPNNTTEPNSPEIIKAEYTDGFGRLLQTRTQAEDVIFGDPTFGDSGLPENQSAQNQAAIGIERGANDRLNVVVSGWKIYNNKGKVVEQYEPYFDKGFDYSPPFDNALSLIGGTGGGFGEKIRMFYDPRGNVIRTISPDNSEQWVIHGDAKRNENGQAQQLNTVAVNASQHWKFENYYPTPWESYTYDANDIFPGLHQYTPANSVVDALGRVVITKQRLQNEEVIIKTKYDIQGNVLQITDALNRISFTHIYDLAKKPLKSWNIDAGTSIKIIDATNKLIEAHDSKGAVVLNTYDVLHRVKSIHIKDNNSSAFTLRQYLFYGETSGLATPELYNLKGKLYRHHDDAGMSEIPIYDFKGNALKKRRKNIKDSELQQTIRYQTDWTPGIGQTIEQYANTILEHKAYTNDTATDGFESELTYDALNRTLEVIYPKDTENKRKVIVPTYNRGGGLQKVKLLDDIGSINETEYVKEIAYNAKGQRLLIAYGNQMMTRYTYDKKTFRLKHLKSEKYTYTTPQSNQHQYSSNGGVQQDFAYLYDLVGNILQIRDVTTGSGVNATPDELTRQFTYDALYRLLNATGRECNTTPTNPWDETSTCTDPNNRQLYTQRYVYDKMGNIQTLQHIATGNSFTRTFNYSNINSNNLLDSITVGANTFSSIYDDCGNLTQQNTDKFYEWDYANRLGFFKIEASGATSKYAHYLYDASGNRVKKIVVDQQGNYTTTNYIDGVFEYEFIDDSNGLHERNYLHINDNKSRIATQRVGSDYDDINDDAFYILEDHLNSSNKRLNATNGSVIDEEEFYPFGESSYQNFSKKRYRFCGKEKDGESGLYYYGLRFYSAWTCRFISVDPLAAKFPYYTSYQYAGNKPITFIDLDGGEESGNNTTNSNSNSNSQTQQNNVSINTGDKEFDGLASQVATKYANCEGVTVKINIHQGADGAINGRSISITKDDKTETMNYTPDKGFYDNEGNSFKHNPTSSNAVGSALSAGDASIRLKDYLPKLPEITKEGIQKIEAAEKLGDLPAATNAAKSASDTRNALRSGVQEKLSPSGKALSEAMEQERNYETVKGDLAKRTGKSGFELEKEVARSAGRSSGEGKWYSLKNISKVGKVLGYVAAVVGIVISAIRVITSKNWKETLSEEVGSWTLGTLGAIAGGILAAGICAFAAGLLGVGALPAIAVIAVGVTLAFLGGWLMGNIGAKTGRNIYNEGRLIF